jgi:hypothetical protein
LLDAGRVGEYVGAVDELVDGADEAEVAQRGFGHARFGESVGVEYEEWAVVERANGGFEWLGQS